MGLRRDGRRSQRAHEEGGGHLRIAYDLRFAGDHFTGIGTHAFLLLEALSREAGADAFLALWDPRLKQTRYDSAALRARGNIHWHERLIAPLGAASPFQVGNWLRSLGADVYFSPFYVLPVAPPCPCVLTLHDVWPQRLPAGLSTPKRWVHHFLMWRAARAARVVTSSEFSRREIAALTPIPSRSVRVVRLGTPALPTSPSQARPPGAPEGPFALGVGVNLPHKNLATVARAWARSSQIEGLELVWAGREDSRHPSLRDLARASGAMRVRPLGWVAQPELEWLYSHATMLLFPSRYEGFGLPLLEAFSRGLPVIAADIPVLREAGDGVAMFCGPEDISGWANAIRAVATDAGLRERMREAGIRRAHEYSYSRTARETMDVLREAAGRRR